MSQKNYDNENNDNNNNAMNKKNNYFVIGLATA